MRSSSTESRPPAASARFIPSACLTWALAVVLLSLLPLSGTRIYAWPDAGWVGLIALAPCVGWARLALRRSDATPSASTPAVPDSLLLTLLGLLVASATLSSWLAPAAALSLPRLWPTLGGVGLVGAAGALLARGHLTRSRLGAALAIGAGSVATFSLVAWLLAFAGDGSLWSQRNAFPFGHSNYTAGAMVLGLPWLVWAAVRHRGAARLAAALGTVVALTTLLSTSSRGGLLAVLVAAAGTAAIGLAISRASRRTKLLVITAVVFLGLGATFSNARLRNVIIHRQWDAVAQESNDQRLTMLAAARLLYFERPVFGWGPGGVPLAYPTVRPALGGNIDNVLQLHNTPAQLAATLGTPGLLVVALAIAWWVARLRRLLRAPPVVAAWPALASLGAYGVFSLTDHQWEIPFFFAFVALNAALLTHAPTSPVAPALRRLTPVALLLAGLAATPATVRDLAARRHYAHALAADSRDTLFAALARASATQPADPYYDHQTASFAFQFSLETEDPSEKARLLSRAELALEASLTTGVHLEYPLLNLAWLKLSTGRVGEAAAHFQDVIHRFAPGRQDALLGYALAVAQTETPAPAPAILAVAFLQDPPDVLSPLWQQPGGAILRDAALAWIAARSTSLHAMDTRLPPRLADIAGFAATTDSGEPAPPFLRRRSGYGVLALHPDGPAPVDFELIPMSRRQIELNAAEAFRPTHGLPPPLLLSLLHTPPPPDP